MRRRVFRFKWLYTVSIVIHVAISLLFSLFLIRFSKASFILEDFIFDLIFLILNIGITISLFEKFRKTVLLINITFLPLFIWYFSMVCWNLYFGIFSDQSLKKSILIGLYLIMINRFKYKVINDDIDEIGKIENQQ